MAATIKLGSRPKTFGATITIPMHEGGDGKFSVQFVYRTRTEFGAFVDELVKAAGVKPPASQGETDVQYSLQQAMEATRDTNADYLMKIVSGWDLDEQFNRQTVQQLCDELPGAAFALIDKYRAAITEGRLGN